MNWIRSRKGMFLILTVIFALMLVCNIFTAKVADDFTYHYRFDNAERLHDVWEIFPSLVGHAQKMNGRLTAHFWVQLFELFPKWIFNIVNALMFTLQIALIGLIAGGERKPLLLSAVFGAVWILQPGFGQVNLWLDGACNYLWSVVFGLLFLLPFVREFMDGKRICRPAGKIAFIVFSFFAGAYSENGSAAVIFVAALLLTVTAVSRRKKPAAYSILAVAVAFIGYLTIYLAPAQWSNKSAAFEWAVLGKNLINCLEVYLSFWMLLAVFAVLLIWGIAAKTDRKRIVLSLILFAGSLAANFIMAVADYYPERSATPAFILLLVASAVLMQGLSGKIAHRCTGGLALAVTVTAVCFVAVGVQDIYQTDLLIRQNEAYIYECKEQGITDITLPMVEAQTKYSALYGLKYLDTKTTETWPNKSMSRYYGVNSIIGTD